MNDVVYVVRDGPNPELRYSLRSLRNVSPLGRVWIIGGAPAWVNPSTVTCIDRPNIGSAYTASRSHLATACRNPEISNPFWLWHDDFFAMRPTVVTARHRGSLHDLMKRFEKTPTVWARGLKEVAAYLRDHDNPLSYDLHVPLLVRKDKMLEALEIGKSFKSDSYHLYTLYGNLWALGGVETPDPKMLRKSDPFPTGPWLSSSDSTFRSVIEPVLRYTFPDPGPHERY